MRAQEKKKGKKKGKRKENQTLAEKLEGMAVTALDDIICVYLIMLLVVFPFYNEEGYSHIGTDKGTFFCKVFSMAGILAAVPLLICLGRRLSELKKNGGLSTSVRKAVSAGKVNFVDLFALFYGAALLLSYIFAIDHEEALWGTRGWFMGFLPHLSLIVTYFLVSRFWKPRKWLFCLILPVSAAVFFMACVNRFGYYPFGMESAGHSFISTIGNINWYCGYAVSVTFAGVALFWLGREWKTWQKVFLTAYTVLGYLSLLLQGSDSGILALAVVLLSMFCLSVQDSDRMLAFWQQMALLWGSCLAIRLLVLLTPLEMTFVGSGVAILLKTPFCVSMTVVSVLALSLVWADKRKGRYRKKLFRVLAWTAAVGAAVGVLGVSLMVVVNTLRPGSLGALSEKPLFTFDAYWGSSRGATWSAGWRCFLAQNPLHKLVGVGPDCMWSYINSGSSPELLADVQLRFGGSRLTNAHNEWLTILVDEGILGLIGYGGMIICGIRELLGKAKGNPFVMACGLSLLAYTVNNIFSFQQAMSVGTIFVLFGMGKAFLREEEGVT